MYCNYLNGECYSGINCVDCYYYKLNYAPLSQFNYECPDCHGKFNYPSIPSVTSSIYYKCPFCGRLMEGLK